MRFVFMLVALSALAAPALAVEPNRTNTAAPARWPFEQQVGTFLVHSDYDITPRSPLLGQLADLKTELEQQLQIQIHDEQVHLILFAQHHNYRNYLRLYFPNIPDRQALFVKRRGPGMVFAYENKNMEVDLRHETTHALLNASLPYVPLWLDEGLAEYFEPPVERRAASSPHHRTVKLRALVGRVPDIVELEDIAGVGEMGAAQYRDAWSWVHFLLHESDQSRQVLVRFLRELQAHSPPGSLARRLAAEMPDYRKRYLKHFR
ncbi:DUF1570 domain-containing protein [Roseimaritima ulvae]|uniref:DUF1570 domain-containing protein n=1 Tax=Roseimaritima ulvae TaxID=980254 RepID=A0A5B9QXY8_9BACT|nr:DUF1570 domain-containing protein [Roseimaritima ulvae]QEG41956.1 hypothetical protein UC8_39850 [Roseimaritima ulvae]